jgi:hypothetical protein
VILLSLLSVLSELCGAGRFQPIGDILGAWILVVLFMLPHYVTALSYTLIGISLMVNRVRWVAMSGATRVMYGLFITLCAFHHLVSGTTALAGVFYLDIMALWMMGGISAVTAAFTAQALLGTWRAGRGPPGGLGGG